MILTIQEQQLFNLKVMHRGQKLISLLCLLNSPIYYQQRHHGFEQPVRSCIFATRQR